jgi:hypothetical protein
MLKTRIGIIAVIAMMALLGAAGVSASTIYTSRAAWTAQVSGITTEDFNALSGNEYQTLTLGNVTFDVPGYPDSSALWVSCPSCYNPPFSIALVGNHWLTTVRGMFATPVAAVGADVANLGVNDTIAIDVDINGTWYQWNVAYTYPNAFFWGIVAGQGETIDGITFTPTTNNWVGIDNFSYGGTASPEPGTIALLGSGILGLAGILRRKLML